MSQQIKQVTARIYQMGNKHIAGQHSLTTGELLCFAVAAVMVFAPQLWAKMPLIGKWGSPTAALIIMLIALVIW